MELDNRIHVPQPSDGLLKDDHTLEELEAQSPTTSSSPESAAPIEYSISTNRKLAFLSLYFFLNLGLTLSNKAVMQHLKFPWLLTVMHTGSTSIGCTALLLAGHLRLSKLATKENLILVAFSSLFTLNIAISNVSL